MSRATYGQLLPSMPNNYLAALQSNPRAAISELEKVIGRLPNSEKYDYVENQSRVFGDLTELLLKRAPAAVDRIITGLLTSTYVSPYTSFLLPIRELGDFESINVTWSEMHFAPGVATQVETLGIPRYFTHQKAKRGARAVRRGAAVMIESGFFMTPEGREEFSMQIRQLATIIQETNEYDVLITLLQTPMRNETHAHDMNGPYNSIYGSIPTLSFEERLTLARDMTGIVNKTPDSRGFTALVTNTRTIMERNGVRPDAMICPPYMLGYYWLSKDDLYHFDKAGPSVNENRELATDIGNYGPFRSKQFQGLTLIDTHVYRPVPNARTSASDILTTPIQIGEFYPMEINRIYRDSRAFENYRSSSRDVMIFNEEQSRFVPVYFIDAVANSFRWESRGEDALLHEERHAEVENDMFRNNTTVKAWGDMLTEYLPDEAVDRTIITFIYNVLDKNFREQLQALPPDTPANDPLYVRLKNVIIQSFHTFGNEQNKLPKVNDAYVANNLQDFFEMQNGDTLSHDYLRNSSLAFNREPIFGNTKPRFYRIIAYIFLVSPIRLANFRKLHSSDVFVPVDIVLARPWMTYQASTVVVMRAGKETGELIMGHRDFSMSSNTMEKSLQGSMTYYSKAIVKDSNAVLVAPHVFIQSYVSGNNVEFLSDEVLENEIHDRSGVFESSESLVAMMVPYGSSSHKFSWIDYRGKNTNVPGKIFHRAAEFYTNLFALDVNEIYNPLENFIDYEEGVYAPNTITWAGHIAYGPDYKYQSLCQGHLGPNTYAMVNQSRKVGQYVAVKQQTYTAQELN